MTQLSDTDLFGRPRALHESVRPVTRMCRLCGAAIEVTPQAEALLCAACLSRPDLEAEIEQGLMANLMAREALQERWLARVSGLPDPLSERWGALVAARDAAERAVEKVLRGSRRAGAVVPSTALGDARRALRAVRAKIERTAERDPDIALLLEEEQGHKRELERLYEDRARLEMSRPEATEARHARAEVGE
jgi:hypothetical protein